MKLFKKAKARFHTIDSGQNSSPTGSQVSSVSNLPTIETRDSVWEGVKTALRMIKESADAFPPLKSTVGGLLGIIDLVENTRSNEEEAIRIQRTLNAMVTVLKTSSLRSLNNHGDTSVRIDGIVASINEQILLIQRVLDRSRSAAFANATKDKSDIGAVLRQISDLLNVFLIETCLSTETISAETFNVVSKAYLKDELKPVYEAFHTADGPIPRHLCTPKTRAEILSVLISWATNADNNRIYCLSGMAGTGKTTIVNTLCRILERSRLLGGSFFCSRADTDCSSANRIIPSIVYQLAIQFPSFRSQVIKSLENMETGSVERSFRHLLVEPLKACVPEIMAPIVIVIDALDECRNENHISALLSHVWTHAPTLPVKFLLTFRPDRVFQSRLHLSDSSSTKIHLHDVEESLVERDIRLFLEERLHLLAQDQRSRGITVESTWPPEAEFNALHSLAGKLFIYAATTCEYIGSGGVITERLSQVIQMGHNPTRIQASSIDELYTSILDAAIRHLEQREKDRLLRILSAIIYAQKSLTLQSLSSLLSLEVQDVRASLTELHSVLHIRTQDDRSLVSTLHASFSDYLGDSERSRGYFCDFVLGNTMLTHACLSTMDILKENICGLTEDSIPDHIDPQQISESLQYACQFWLTHYYYSSGFSGSLVSKLDDFLSTHVLHWVECSSLLGVLYPTLSALQHLESGVSLTDSNLQSILRDTRRFIAQNIELLKTHPLETYKSALLWLPTDSQIRQKNSRGISIPKILSGLPKYWDLCEMVLTGHSLSIFSVAFSPDGSRLVSGSQSGTVRVWNAETGELEYELTSQGLAVHSLKFSPDGSQIIASSYDLSIRIWYSATGELQHTLTGHIGSVTSVALSPDGSHIISGSYGDTIRVWNLRTGRPEHKLTGHSDRVMSVAFSPGGSHIISGSGDKTVRVWNSATGELEHKLTGHSGLIASIACSPDGHHIVSGSHDSTARVWNLETGESEYELTGHSKAVNSVAFSPDGSRILSGSDDGTIRIWISATGVAEHTLTGASGSLSTFAFSSDGSRIVSGSVDNTIQVWDPATGQLEHSLTGHSKSVKCVVFSPDGSRIASGSEDTTVRVWNAATEHSEPELTGHSGSISSVAVSPDGSRIVSGSYDKTVRVWNSETGALERILNGHSDSVTSVAFSSDGSHIASGSFDATIRVWNTSSGESEYEMIDCANSIMSLAFSPDGSRIAACSSDANVQLWNFTTGELERELIDETYGAKFVAFSADGSQVVFGSVDFIVRVWNLTIGKSLFLSTSVVLPDQSVVKYQESKPRFTISDDQSVTPRPLFSFSEDRRWLTISSTKSRYWIPPSYSVLNSYKFFANRAILAYSSGTLLILAADR